MNCYPPISAAFDSAIYARFEISRQALLQLRHEVTSSYSQICYGTTGDQHYEELKRQLNNYPLLVNAIFRNEYFSIGTEITAREFARKAYTSSMLDKDLWFVMKQFHHGSESVLKCLRNVSTKNKILQHNGNRLNTKVNQIPEYCEMVGNVGETIAARLLPRIIPGQWEPAGKLVWDDYPIFGVTPDYIKYEIGSNPNPFDGNPIGVAEVKSTALVRSRESLNGYDLRPESVQRWIELTRKPAQQKEFVRYSSKKLASLKWLKNETYDLITREVNDTIKWNSVTICGDDDPKTHEWLDSRTNFLIGNLNANGIVATPLIGKTWCQTIGEMMTIAKLTTLPVVEGVIMFVNLNADKLPVQKWERETPIPQYPFR